MRVLQLTPTLPSHTTSHHRNNVFFAPSPAPLSVMGDSDEPERPGAAVSFRSRVCAQCSRTHAHIHLRPSRWTSGRASRRSARCAARARALRARAPAVVAQAAHRRKVEADATPQRRAEPRRGDVYRGPRVPRQRPASRACRAAVPRDHRLARVVMVGRVWIDTSWVIIR